MYIIEVSSILFCTNTDIKYYSSIKERNYAICKKMSKTKFNILHKMSQTWTVKDCILSHTLGRYKRGKGYLSEGQRGIIKE